MNSEFPSILSSLRKSKGISQRQAAEVLEVSQALLSHYENGIREPGFDFLVRVGEYYGISIDYLLGRTKVKINPFLEEGLMPKFSVELTDEVLSKLNEESRLLLTSLSLVITLLARMSGKEGIDCASTYFKTQIYRVFRLVRQYIGEDEFKMIQLPAEQVDFVCDYEVKTALIKLSRHLSRLFKNSITDEQIKQKYSEDAIMQRFGSIFSSFEEVISSIDEKLIKLTESDPG